MNLSLFSQYSFLFSICLGFTRANSNPYYTFVPHRSIHTWLHLNNCNFTIRK